MVRKLKEDSMFDLSRLDTVIEKLIFLYLGKYPNKTQKQLYNELGISEKACSKNLKKLVEKNLCRKITNEQGINLYKLSELGEMIFESVFRPHKL
jgi:DNA-binding MarR family transcriptional regulator